MRSSLRALFAFGLIAAFAATGFAEDAKKPAAAPQMPEMGAPKQIKAMADVCGKWKVDTKMKMAPTDTAWTEAPGECTFEFSLDSCIIVQNFSSTMMGMPYKGMGMLTYNRDTKMFEQTWTDNMSAHTSVYQGKKDPKTGDVVYKNTEMMMGVKTWTKMTLHITDKDHMTANFDSSTDGKTFANLMVLSYSR